MSIEYGPEDVNRKFNATVCCVEILPTGVKGFFYLQEHPDGFKLTDSQGKEVGVYRDKKLKFTYHRFASGWYPSMKDDTGIYIKHKPLNKNYTMGLSGSSHDIYSGIGARIEPLTCFKRLSGTFDKLKYPTYNPYTPNGNALSLLFGYIGDQIKDIFYQSVAVIDKVNKTVRAIKHTQELEDIVTRSFPAGWTYKRQ